MSDTVKMLVVVALITTASPAYAEWVRVAGGVNGSVYFMDPARITKSGDRTHAWIKVDHSKNQSVKYRSEMQLKSYICSSRKSRLLQYTEYDSYGKVVGSESFTDFTYSESGYSHVTPDTVEETLLTIACAYS
jgi:hypothetical protein